MVGKFAGEALFQFCHAADQFAVSGERFVEALRQAIAAQPLLACTLAGEIDAPHFARTERAEIPLPVAEFTSEASAAAYFDRLAHTPFDLRRGRGDGAGIGCR